MVARSRRREEKLYTYADYCGWTEEKRCELIDGVVYDMNAPLRTHQKVLGQFFFKFMSFFEGKKCEVYPAPFDVRISYLGKNDNEIFTVVQPDISVICDPDKLDDKGCIGVPDLVVEILSPSSASYDNIKKRDLYEKIGVREFWLVHPTDMLVTIYNLENGVYGRPRIFDRSLIADSEIFKGLEVKVSDIFGPPPSLEECPEPWRTEILSKNPILARADNHPPPKNPSPRKGGSHPPQKSVSVSVSKSKSSPSSNNHKKAVTPTRSKGK